MNTTIKWRPAGPVRTETLIGYPGSGEALEQAKDLGVRAIAVHVGWGRVEPEEGKWDWSGVERRAREILSHGLLWAPGLVFTDSVPKWFEGKGLSVKQRCVEHGKENGQESVWNPNLGPYLRRFYEAFAEHFRGELLDSAYEIELFLCQYGETNYFFIDRSGPPVAGWGGALHYGFQCGDDLAREDLRRFARERYGSIETLNSAWGTDCRDFAEVEFEVPPEERDDPKNDFTRAFDEETHTYVFDEYVRERRRLGRRWTDQLRWYKDSMNDYFEFMVKSAREVFPDRRLAARLGGCSYLPWLGSDTALNIKTAARHGVEIRFTGAVHYYDQKVISSACRLYRTPMWTEPMYAIGRRTGPTLMRARRWFDAVFLGASCGQAVTRDEYTNSFFVDAKPVEANFPVYRKAVEATAFGQPFVRFATLLPTTQSFFGFDHRYFMKKLDVLLDYTDADVLDETLIADGALQKYDALLVRMGGLVGKETIERLDEFARGGGLVAFGPKGFLETLDDPEASYKLLGLPAGKDLLPGGDGHVVRSLPLKRLEGEHAFRAEAACEAPEGEVLARAGGAACMWLRRLGEGAALVCLSDEDDVLIGAFLDLAEGMLGIHVPDGKRDGVFMTRLGEELLVFNRNERPAEVEPAGRKLALEPYDETSLPLVRVRTAAPGPGIGGLELKTTGDGLTVRLAAPQGSSGAYIELLRPDRRTIYLDLRKEHGSLSGDLKLARAGTHLLTVYLLDEKGRPSSWRRFEVEVSP